MKIIWPFIKPIFQVIGVTFGAYVVLDQWIVGKVQTNIIPVEAKLTAHISQGDTRREYIYGSLERLERESIMMRSNQEKTIDLLMKISQERN